MLLALLMPLSSAAYAADCSTSPVHVDGTGYANLASALVAATSGSEVALCPGTYSGNFSTSVPVDLVAVGDASDTILDGGALGTTLTIPAGSSVSGLTIQNGAATDGAGLVLSSAGELTLIDVVLTGNIAENAGGGLWVPGGSTVDMVGTRVEANEAFMGGGIYSGEGDSIFYLNDSVISMNEVISYSERISDTLSRIKTGRGGGIFMDGGEIYDGVIQDNMAFSEYAAGRYAGDGGGVYLESATTLTNTQILSNQSQYGGGVQTRADLELDHVLIEDNTAYYSGGGIYITANDTLSVDASGSIIQGNTATLGGGGGVYLYAVRAEVSWTGGEFGFNMAGYGGALMLNYGEYTISDIVVHDNSARSYGGGLETNYGTPFYDGRVDLEDSVFFNNHAARDGGGMDSGLGGSIKDTVFEGNTAEGNGGGLSLFGYGSYTSYADAPQTYTLEDVEIRSNTADDAGGAISIVDQGVLVGSDLTIFDNRAGSGGGIAIIEGDLSLTDTDLGSCPDNLPDDIYADAGPVSEVNFGVVSSLSCDESGCTTSAPALSCVDPSASACVDPDASVGYSVSLADEVRVQADALVRDRASVADQSLIGEGATVGHDAEVGSMSQVCYDGVIRDRASIGDNVTIEEGAQVGHDAEVADGARIGPSSRIQDRASVGEAVIIGSNSQIGSDVTIEAGAIIGDNVTIRDRATIGADAVIGDGVLINYDEDVDAGEIVEAP